VERIADEAATRDGDDIAAAFVILGAPAVRMLLEAPAIPCNDFIDDVLRLDFIFEIDFLTVAIEAIFPLLADFDWAEVRATGVIPAGFAAFAAAAFLAAVTAAAASAAAAAEFPPEEWIEPEGGEGERVLDVAPVDTLYVKSANLRNSTLLIVSVPSRPDIESVTVAAPEAIVY
jgi:hypothetical protein